MAIYCNGYAKVEIMESFDYEGITLIKAKQISAYNDGSGEDDIGRVLCSSDKTAKGWATLNDVKADDGWKEISAAIEAAQKVSPPENVKELMHYYYPMMFTKAGKRKKI